jgi:glycosyltransferase involved in cell wall biosynthesis
LVDLKGVDVLLDAFAQIQENDRRTHVKLKIVGDGPERKKLENQCEKLRLGELVEFLGAQPVEFVRQEFLPSLHLFVNPSFQEGLPTTVIEALASQCRVVATDVGGTREILRYASFVLVAPRNVRALADGIQNQIDALSKEPTRTLPVSLFSWEQTFREIKEVYYSF